MNGSPTLCESNISWILAFFFFFTSQASSLQMQCCTVMVKKTASWYEMLLMVSHIVGGVDLHKTSLNITRNVAKVCCNKPIKSQWELIPQCYKIGL